MKLTVIGICLLSLWAFGWGQKMEAQGRQFFPLQLRGQGPSKMFDFVEAAFASYKVDSVNTRFGNIRFQKGMWEDLETVDDSTPFRWANIDGRAYRLEWQLPDRDIVMVFPIEYDKLNGKTRQELEDAFIQGVKHFEVKALRPKPEVDRERLQLVRDSLFRLPGEEYLLSEVNSHSYLVPDSAGNAVFVCDSIYWLESLANLFVVGSELWRQARMEVTVLKYEYGQRETFEIGVETLVQFCEANGCKTYWGVESREGDELKASVLFYNPWEGYNHLFRVTCKKSPQGDIPFTLQARASLYVPISNVDNLFE